MSLRDKIFNGFRVEPEYKEAEYRGEQVLFKELNYNERDRVDEFAKIVKKDSDNQKFDFDVLKTMFGIVCESVRDKKTKEAIFFYKDYDDLMTNYGVDVSFIKELYTKYTDLFHSKTEVEKKKS